MTMPRFDTLNEHFVDGSNDPLGFGKVFFFDAGTMTEKDTFKDPALQIKNSNPVILTASGKWPNQVWFDGTARVILQDSKGGAVIRYDQIGIRSHQI